MSGQLALVRHLLVGKAAPYTRPGTVSGIDKRPQSRRLAATATGLTGDEQGDPRVHGGPEKAIHLYPFEHYTFWRQALGDLPLLQQPGAFGENLSTLGVTEDSIYLGDRVRVGTALLEVSQGRQPCWKLNDRFGVGDMARRMQASLRTGWYFRVLDAGTLGAGDTLELVERPWPDWPLNRVMALVYGRCLDPDQLREAQHLPMGERWHRLIARRLAKGTVEDWSPRLEGPPESDRDSP